MVSVLGVRRLDRFSFSRLAFVLCVALLPTTLLVHSTQKADALALGGGTYHVVASVYGVPSDDLIGEETSSGHVLAAFDRLVALPACTESSCPWLKQGTGKGGEWGPQTTCAEDDGLCWVEVTSLDTGACTVAPVLDLGPLFTKDNWWSVRDFRTYRLKMGLPAAEAARDGMDLGFGAGISDRGYDIQNTYDYAAAVDLGAGTWADLGLDEGQGYGDVEIRLLWQKGIDHEDACGEYGNARTVDTVRLRAGPSTNTDILADLETGDRLGIIGGQQDGFYPVVHNGLTGWVSDDYVAPDGTNKAGAAIGIVKSILNFRAGPSTSDEIIARMPAGSLVLLTGEEENGFLSATFNGEAGWAFWEYLDTGEGFGEGGGDPGRGIANTTVTTDAVNLRRGPSLSDEIKLVVPSGATVILTGSQRNGFVTVDYKGTRGWLSSEYLKGAAASSDKTRTITEPLNLRTGSSSGAEVILVMPVGGKVTLRGEEKNGFAPVTYNGKNGWAYSQYLS